MWVLLNRTLILITICFVAIGVVNGSIPCNKRSYGKSSFVCVCTSQSCDTIDPVKPAPNGTYIVYTSDRASQRFALHNGNILPGVNLAKSGRFGFSSQTVINITINQDVKQQKMLGFGGAFTDATGINLSKLSPDTQKKVLHSYFGPDGIEYNFGRVPIGGTDFSTKGYTYADSESDDPRLEHFALQKEDHLYKIPFIKDAKLINPDLRLFASAWTAPKWIKTNNNYNGGRIKDEYYQTWADYYIKFFENYEKEGVKFWGVTTGNEPSLAIINSVINSVAWTSRNMNKWVGTNLGPTIRSSKYKHLKIMCLDDQRFYLPWYPELVMSNGTGKYIDGIAVHWYWDRVFPSILLKYTHQKFPGKFILGTESCRGDKFWEPAVVLGDWSRAEDYAHGMIQDFNNFVTGWVDWNMALNSTGGPTYIDNRVDSPIIVADDGKEFYKEPMYYALGHFSKFVTRGSFKIAQNVSDKNVEVAAFLRPDSGVVVVILNKLEKEHLVVINDVKKGHFEVKIEAQSIKTVLYW